MSRLTGVYKIFSYRMLKRMSDIYIGLCLFTGNLLKSPLGLGLEAILFKLIVTKIAIISTLHLYLLINKVMKL